MFMSKTAGACSFFKGFMWAAQGANMGYRWKVGNGKKVRQWEDNGLGSSSLAIQFWLLYRIVNKKNCSFAELWAGVPIAESSRSVWSLGKGVSGKPYPRLCNARRPRLEGWLGILTVTAKPILTCNSLEVA